MQITLDAPDGTYRITGYGPGFVLVNEQRIDRSLVLTPDRLVVDWPPTELAHIEPGHMDVVADLAPEIVLLGTGLVQRFPDTAIMARFLSNHVGFEVMDTPAACRTYNILVAEGRKVAAALLLGLH